MGHLMVAFKRNLDWSLKLHVARTWYIPYCKEIFIYSHVTFHFIMLPDHDGSDQFGFFFFVDKGRLLLCPRCRRERTFYTSGMYPVL